LDEIWHADAARHGDGGDKVKIKTEKKLHTDNFQATM